MEWKALGDWAAYNQIGALKDKSNLLVFGAGADYTEAGSQGQLVHTVDVQFDTPDGLGLYANYMGRYSSNIAGVATHNFAYEPSVLGQISYVIQNHWEPFARYEYINVDPDYLTGVAKKSNNFREITAA